MPQAAGTGYALKVSKKKAVCVCYFGDGAASEGDAHPAFNFSATTESPVLWFCRNNAYAISTPFEDQYRGDGIAARAYGYGMLGCRFDGNDLLAVYDVCKKARQMSIQQSRPIMLEAMTYRGAHHSTSDNSATYRHESEESKWIANHSPILRMRAFLYKQGLWDEKKNNEWIAHCRELIEKAYKSAEETKKPHWRHLFTDVYDVPTPALIAQEKELEAHLQQYGHEEYYKLSTFSDKM